MADPFAPRGSDPRAWPADGAVFRSTSRDACLEQALVLRALGIPFEVRPMEGAWWLLVPPELAARARHELEIYRAENVDWPPRYETPAPLSNGGLGAALYALTLIVMHPVGRRGFFGHNFWEEGKMEAAAVRSGEWWRALTSLSLHADVAHLVGNVIFGAALGVLASHSLGGGLPWVGFLVAGGLGNLLNAWLSGPAHSAIGASTGVFGVLGIVSAYEWMRRHTLRHPMLRRLAPLAAGGVFLGWFGMGGPDRQTDVLAHVTGAAAGLVLGVAAALWLAPREHSPAARAATGLASLAALAAAWGLALAG